MEASAVKKTETPVVRGAPVSPQVVDQEYFARWSLLQRMGVAYSKTTNLGRFRQKLEKALSNGALSREEASEVFGFEIKEAAWIAWTGGKGHISLEKLDKIMLEFADYRVATGKTFQEFADYDRVASVPYDNLREAWEYHLATEKDRAAFVAKHQTLLQELLGRITGRVYNEERPVEVEDIEDLTPTQKRQLLIGLYDRCCEAIFTDRLELTTGMKDPVVARKFIGTIFVKYLTSAAETDEITESSIEELNEFAEKVEELRRSVGDAILEGVDPGVNLKKFKKVLQLFEDNPGKNRSEIFRLLGELKEESSQWRQRMIAERSGKVPGVGTPASE